MNGFNIYDAIIFASESLIDAEAYLNKINIYPVADRDTGTNLADTMRGLIHIAQPDMSVKTTLDDIALAAMSSAKGGSGNNIAHFIDGMARNCENDTLDLKELPEILQKACRHVDHRMPNAPEGTMGEVINEYEIFLKNHQDLSVEERLWRAADRADEIVKKSALTNEKNAIDAGSSGIALFIRRLTERLIEPKNTDSKNYHIIDKQPYADFAQKPTERRYQVDTILIGDRLDEALLSASLQSTTDEFFLSGSANKMRLIFNTNDPCQAMEVLQKNAFAVYQNIRDLSREKTVEKQHLRIGILTDSSNDLPQNLLDKHLIEVVPLSINIGQEAYFDTVTISSQRFTERLVNEKNVITTAQPCFKAFYDRYRSMSKYCDAIIAVHITGNLSGTLRNSLRAADNISEETGTPIVVLDGNNTTCGLGLLLLRIAEEIEKDTPFNELVEKINSWIPQNRIFITCLTTRYLLNSGRLGSIKGNLTALLGLKPLISFNEEKKLVKIAIDFTHKSNRRHVIEQIKTFIAGRKVWNYSLADVDNKEAIAAYRQLMLELTAKEPLFISEPSPMLISKVGPQASAIDIMIEE